MEKVPVSLALAIARAESGFVSNAKNPDSSASGVFQFINGTWTTWCVKKYGISVGLEEKLKPMLQVNCAIEMLKEPKGYMHWWASSASWKHLLELEPIT